MKSHQTRTLTVEEVDFAKLMAEGVQDKPIGRRIRILAGDILANVIPNPEIATEF